MQWWERVDGGSPRDSILRVDRPGRTRVTWRM